MSARTVRLRRWLGMPLAFLGLAVFTVGVMSSGASADPPLLSDFGVSGPTVSVSNGATTYTWTLTGTHGHETEEVLDVSHVVIDTCLGNTETGGNFTDDWGQDGTHTFNSSQIFGHKWESNPAVGATFSLTFPGELDATGTADVFIAKSGEHIRVVTGGPSCQTSTTVAPTTTTEAPTTTTTIGDQAVATTTTAAVAGVVETTTTTAQVAGEVVERPRAAPEQLPLTGGGDRAAFMIGTGIVLMGMGTVLQLMLRRRAIS